MPWPVAAPGEDSSRSWVEDFRDPRLGEVFQALHALDGELGERCDKRLLDRAQESIHAVVGRLLMEMPEGEIDLIAEIETLLDRRRQLLEDERKQARRQEIQRRYHAGEDWRQEVRPEDDEGESRGGHQA